MHDHLGEHHPLSSCEETSSEVISSPQYYLALAGKRGEKLSSIHAAGGWDEVGK